MRDKAAELPPEIAALVPPESQRHIPVPVVVKGDSSEKQIPVSELPFDFHTVENQYAQSILRKPFVRACTILELKAIKSVLIF
mgnify:CR=1 FL=1